MEIIKKQFDDMFTNLNSQENVMKHPIDPSGKSTIKYVYYYFDNGDVVSINCYDWSDEMPYWDNLDISLDTKDFDTPDSIFPNNWVSFHGNGSVGLYPMYARNRRDERREDIFEFFNEN